MGLLKRKQKQPIQQLQSKNPTGLPTQQQEHSSVGSNTSMIAAQAAAALLYNKPTQSSKSTALPTKCKVSHSAVTQPKSIGLVRPPTSRPNVSMSVSPRARSPLYDGSTNSLPHDSMARLHKELAHLSTSIQSNPQSYGSTLSVQAANVASKKSLSTQDLLQPPVSIGHNGFYSSSASSAISSVHSFESLPSYAKVPYVHDSSLLKLKSPESLSVDSLGESLTIDELGNLNLGDHRGDSKSRNSFDRSKDSFSGMFFPEGVSQPFDNFDSERESHVSDLSYQSNISSRNYNAPVGKSLDFIPSTIVEDSIEEEHQVNTQVSRDHTRRGSSTVLPARKPPPKSPELISSPFDPSLSSSLVLSSPAREESASRPSSPRRKPPSDAFYNDSLTATDSEKDNAFEDNDDELPRLTFQNLSRNASYDSNYHKHRQHHVLNQGLRTTKKFWMKSLKPSKKHEESKDYTGQLRSTLRKEKKKETFNEDKPWKHHNDRDFISESERKRYEGVWVSNKGLYMDMVDPETLARHREEPIDISTALQASRLSTNHVENELEDNLILNLIVRELWSRSKLPLDQLRQIWDLVDTRRDGTLDKTSFIVGMWYIDQCLYGRKLPKFVEENVWSSVSHIGVNVVIKPKRKR